MKRERSIDIDAVRFFVASIIVAVHTYPLESYSAVANHAFSQVFSRFCVPLFLVISGYFILEKALGDFKKMVTFTKKLIRLYAISSLIYLPILIYNGYFVDFSIGSFASDILFNGIYFHLWYFPATILGIWIVYFLLKKLGMKKAWIVCLSLYLIGMAGDSYYGFVSQIPFIKVVYDVLFKVSFYTRNGVFYAPVFLLMGYTIAIAKNENRKMKDAILGCVFFIIMMAEGMILYYLGWPRHTTMYFSLIPMCYFLFKYILSGKIGANPFLREVGTWTYIMHPFMMTGIRFLGKMLHMDVIYRQSMLYFVFTLILTLAFSFGFAFAKTTLKNKNVHLHK